MRTRLVLWLIATAARSTRVRLVERFRRLDLPDEAGEFIAELRAVGEGEAGPPLDVLEAAPIYDVLTEQWPALYAGRHRVRHAALLAPTQEIRTAFDLLTVDWLCTSCEADHVDCHGCSCACAGAALVMTR